MMKNKQQDSAIETAGGGDGDRPYDVEIVPRFGKVYSKSYVKFECQHMNNPRSL